MIKKISWWLMWIGALNWGLVGIGGFMGSNWNLVNLIFGGMPVLEMIIYILVGLSAVVAMSSCQGCNGCGKGKCEACAMGSCSMHEKKM